MLFKACGIRNIETLTDDILDNVDLFGVNFSPLSKRRPDKSLLEDILEKIPREKQVFVFKENTIDEINDCILKYSPGYVQLYEYEFLSKVSERVKRIFACQIQHEEDLKRVVQYNSYDILLLEGAGSGKGVQINSVLDLDKVEIPFLLAGGINEENVKNKVTKFSNCIGADLASGIEENGLVSRDKILKISRVLKDIVEVV